MPGPYSKPKSVTIVGAGRGRTKKRIPRGFKPIKPKIPFPGYSDKDKQAIIKVWEDRNRSNNNTKLNP